MSDNRSFISDLKDLVTFHVEHSAVDSNDFKYVSSFGELVLHLDAGKFETLANEINEIVRDEMTRRINAAVDDKLKSQALLNELKDRTE